MFKVSISILGKSLFDLKEDIKLIENSNADMLHIDMLDNNFAKGLSYPINFLKDLKSQTKLKIDTHFMIMDIESILDDIIKCKPDIVTFHYESTKNPFFVIDKLHKNNILAGVSILPQTPEWSLVPLLNYVDLVLVLSVSPGISGQGIILSCLDKLKNLANLKEQKSYRYDLEIDGGVNENNYQRIQECNPDILVSSSGFFNSVNKSQYVLSLKGKDLV